MANYKCECGEDIEFDNVACWCGEVSDFGTLEEVPSKPKAKAKTCNLCGKALFLFIDRKEAIEYDTLDEPDEPFCIEITGSWLCTEFCHDSKTFKYETQTYSLALSVEDLERLHNDNLLG